ncbi:MAG: hypothetical protein JJU00_14115 [Opitutales bacterium]|nr:hypothetical protein [Opitutales bacterium]
MNLSCKFGLCRAVILAPAVLCLSSAYSSYAAELRVEDGVWKLDTLILGGAGSGDEAVLFDFSGADALPGTVGFLFGGGVLDVEAGDVVLRFVGNGGVVGVSGAVVGGDAAGWLPLGDVAAGEDTEGMPVWIDATAGRVSAGGSEFEIPFPPTAWGRPESVVFANPLEEAHVVTALVIGPSGAGDVAFDGGGAAPSAAAPGYAVEFREDPRFPFPVPVGPPPPHPYLAMDAEGRLLEAPDRPREGPGGRLHSRPGMVRVIVAEPPTDAGDTGEPAE